MNNKEWNRVVQKRLKQMAARAGERREWLNNTNEPKNRDWYIRICGESYRAVSLNEASPLMGFRKAGAKKLDTILNHFEKGEASQSRKENIPERKIQCWLIKQSLNNNLKLSSALALDDKKYDQLLFALDEVSLGDNNHQPIVRCDILAVGVQNGNAFPVLIELKSARDKKRLGEQLENFVCHIKHFSHEFEELLSCCVNKKVSVSEKIGKMIVWPESKNAREESISEFHEEKIDVIEYEWDHNSNINCIKFTPNYF